MSSGAGGGVSSLSGCLKRTSHRQSNGLLSNPFMSEFLIGTNSNIDIVERLFSCIGVFEDDINQIFISVVQL